ncbi:aquaporin isoform X4 [Halyomorpha halys]|uniref:aquaporin isoform X4 n=1 Tax=Halyomorpha halys TaxID=286706 RepID=UPI000D0C7551|nr:aquaporin-like isoform X3 [Halyomorpha halys]
MNIIVDETKSLLNQLNEISTKKNSLSDQGHEMEPSQVERGRKTSVVAQKKSNTQLYRYCQIFLAEFLATTFLMVMVCFGCLTLNADKPIEPLQSSFASGFAVATLVQSFGHISDCHMNPAVTALFLSLGKIDVLTSMIYVFAEVTGATAGYGILWALVPRNIQDINPGHCETVVHSSINSMSGAVIELIITSLLMFMICACLDQRNTHKQDSVPIKFGLTIATISLCAGTLTGASMNPARSFGPAIWHNQWSDHWIYWIAPITAGFIIPKVYYFFFQKDLTIKSLN